ncbi:MAG: DUF177 domain-containing protein [Deltaproteobacteria bacterium]|jgi:uncharacterized protein|nr:DUF177 domain-containing protein [Deltaproteobacteria bacterium]
MDSVRDNLVFGLESWPEAGIQCEFAIAPQFFLEKLKAADLSIDRGTGLEQLVKPATSVRGRIELELTGRRLLVKGAFAVKVEFLCSRCLSPFLGKVADSFNESIDLVTSPNNRLNSEFLDGQIAVVNNQFDLIPLLGEFFWLAYPVKSLCRPDCAGLCPRCGANLNEAPCDCSEAKTTRH